MSNTQEGYVPYGEAGKGKYGSTLGQQACTTLDPVYHDIIHLARNIPFNEDETVFNIGDYGAADGMASMLFFTDLISSLKDRHGSKVQFQVIYEDKPTNDFNSLFKYLHGLLPGPNSYLLEIQDVFAFASGNDFRRQCVPADSMHFILSAVGVQWMSKRIIPYHNSTHVDSNLTENELSALKNQSRADWEDFLMFRSKELRIGGLLVVICTGRFVDENGKATKYTNQIILTIFTKMWLLFRNTGRITMDEFTETNFLECPYTLDELRSPFEDEDSPVSKSGLKIISSEMKTTPCIFHKAWNQKKDTDGIDDREGFAKSYLAAHWNWSNNTFYCGLSSTRPEDEKKQILDEFYAAVEKEIMQKDPTEFKDDMMLSYTVIQKVNDTPL